jgi:hypothetical protein
MVVAKRWWMPSRATVVFIAIVFVWGASLPVLDVVLLPIAPPASPLGQAITIGLFAHLAFWLWVIGALFVHLLRGNLSAACRWFVAGCIVYGLSIVPRLLKSDEFAFTGVLHRVVVERYDRSFSYGVDHPATGRIPVALAPRCVFQWPIHFPFRCSPSTMPRQYTDGGQQQ